MDRRKILTIAVVSTSGLAVLRWGAAAQQASKIYRIGVLVNGAAIVNGKPNTQTESLRAGMAQLGYIEGTNVVYEVRFPEGRLDRLPNFAAELARAGVDIIVAYGGPPTDAARKATKMIPIVVALVADPVAISVAATLERPAGNITGVTNHDPEIAARHMALLKDLLPNIKRVAILSDLDIPGADATGLVPGERANAAAARAAGLVPQVLKLRGPKPDFDGAFKAMTDAAAEALVVLEVPAYFNIPKVVAENATAHRLPTVFWGGAGDAGALISYGTSFSANFSRMPAFVDRILKGSDPANMAFEVVSHRELTINLKTARELGLTIPADLLKRADRVIE